MRAIFLIIFIGLVSSCSKKDKKEDDPYRLYDGTMNALRNGAALKLKLAAVYDSIVNGDRFSLFIIDVHDNAEWDRLFIGNITTTNYIEQKLVAEKDWIRSKDTNLKKTPYIRYNGSFNEGSDVYTPHYLGNTILPKIIIKAYNGVNHKIEGSFQLIFIRDSALSPLGQYLDTVQYTDAVFSATIQSREVFDKGR